MQVIPVQLIFIHHLHRRTTCILLHHRTLPIIITTYHLHHPRPTRATATRLRRHHPRIRRIIRRRRLLPRSPMASSMGINPTDRPHHPHPHTISSSNILMENNPCKANSCLNCKTPKFRLPQQRL